MRRRKARTFLWQWQTKCVRSSRDLKILGIKLCETHHVCKKIFHFARKQLDRLRILRFTNNHRLLLPEGKIGMREIFSLAFCAAFVLAAASAEQCDSQIAPKAKNRILIVLTNQYQLDENRYLRHLFCFICCVVSKLHFFVLSGLPDKKRGIILC